MSQDLMLIKKESINIEPLIHGGKSTTVFRSGTPALPLIVSLMKALKLILPNIDENYKYVSNLNKKICNKLNNYERVHINSTRNSVPNTINFSLKGIKPETFLHALEEYEVYISTKSACSGSNSMSNSVYALTKDKELSNGSLRISLSYMTTEEEIANGMVEISVPQACSVKEESLSKLQSYGIIEKYEYSYYKIYLYLRNFEENEFIDIQVEYKADYPANVTGGSVRVYDYYNPDSEEKNVAEVIIAKHRGGSTGTVKLSWLPSYTKFGNLDRYHTDEM